MIRKFVSGDAGQVSALIHNTLLVSNSREYTYEVLRNVGTSYSPERIVAVARRREIFVYEIDGQISATIGLDGDEITGFFVAPDRQGAGVGKILLAHIETRARANGLRKLRVRASLTSVGFYEKAGYQRKRSEGDEARGVVAVLVKQL